MLGLGIDIRKRGAGLYVGGGGAGGDDAYKNTHALELDGVSEAVRLVNPNDPMAAALATTTDQGTISFWVYFDNLTGTKYIFEKGFDAATNFFRIFYDSSTSSLTLFGTVGGTLSVYQTYASVISPATFHMITVTFDATGGPFVTTLHLDGAELSPDSSFPTSSTAIDPAGGSWWLGKNFSSASYSYQIVDEIAAWDTVLSDDAITEIYTHHNLTEDKGDYTASADLVRWYQLNETAADATGNGADLILINDPSYTETVPFL